MMSRGLFEVLVPSCLPCDCHFLCPGREGTNDGPPDYFTRPTPTEPRHVIAWLELYHTQSDSPNMTDSPHFRHNLHNTWKKKAGHGNVASKSHNHTPKRRKGVNLGTTETRGNTKSATKIHWQELQSESPPYFITAKKNHKLSYSITT